jgi:hypothetical protein
MTGFTSADERVYQELLPELEKRQVAVSGIRFVIASGIAYGGIVHTVGNNRLGLPELVIAVRGISVEQLTEAMNRTHAIVDSTIDNADRSWQSRDIGFDGVIMYRRMAEGAKMYGLLSAVVREQTFLKRFYDNAPFTFILFEDVMTVN